MAGTGSYIAPRLIQAGQVNLNTGTEPRNLSDIINFTQKSNLAESQPAPLTIDWEQALRTVNRYFGTSQVYKEACTKYNCSGGPPLPRDVEIANIVGIPVPVSVGVNPTTNRVYVTSQGANSVAVVDGGSNTILTNIPVNGPYGVSVNPTTNRIYVTNFTTVSVIDGDTNTILTAIDVGGTPTELAVNPTTNRVYVANSVFDSYVSVIDGGTDTVLATIPVARYAHGPSVNPTTNRIYVANSALSSVTVIDGSSNAVITTITVGPVPSRVAVNPATNRVYVTNQNANSVSVIDGGTNTVLSSITVGDTPRGVDVNPTTNRIYVVNSASFSVSVIDSDSDTVLSTVSVGSYPGSVGVNPATNRAYVTNINGAGYQLGNTVSVIGQREEIREPCLLNSFKCVVVSSVGTLFPGTPQSFPVSLVAVSLRSNTTGTGGQMTLTVVCDNNTTNPDQQCSAFYVDGNVWGPGQTDLTKSPFIIQNAEPYFYLQWHWWDFANSRLVDWGTWWHGDQANPNWYWGVYWWWRTYVNYYIGIWLPWWWWVWHWTYWRYWYFWSTNFPYA